MIQQEIHLDYLKQMNHLSRESHQFIDSSLESKLSYTTRRHKFRLHNKSLPNMEDAALFILTREIQDSIVIEYCPPKLFTGKNLTGSLNLLDIRGRAFDIIETYFTDEEKANPLFKEFRSNYIRESIGLIYDLTTAIRVDPSIKDDLLNEDKTPFTYDGRRFKALQIPKDDEPLLSALVVGNRYSSNWISMMLYNKQEEVWARNRGHLYSKEEHAFMKHHIRPEVRFRSKAVEQLGLRDLTKVNSTILRHLGESYLGKITGVPSLPEDGFLSLSVHERDVFAHWEAGLINKWRASVSTATYYRYKKALLQKGIDISKPSQNYLFNQ